MPQMTRLIGHLDEPACDIGALIATAHYETPMTSSVRALSQLYPGQSGRVLEVTAEPALALNMLEIGLVRGATVRYLRSAPWGDPIEVELDGFLLSLRRTEADSVIVGVDTDQGA